MNLRAHAAKLLAPVLRQQGSLQSRFDDAVSDVPARDKALFHELIYGCLRRYEFLNAHINLLLSKKLKAKDADIHALLLLGIYQLAFTRIPDHAAISETVSATKTLKKHWAKGLVNGVLRRFQRESESLLPKIEQQLSAIHNTPEWLLSQLQTDWPEYWQDITEQNGGKPPITLRNNASRQSRNELINTLAERAIDITPTRFATQGLTLASSAAILSLDELKGATLSVQDEAAQLAAELLDLKEGQRVLDACAAPGGKSGHILESADNIDLTAIELEPERAKLISNTLERLQFNARVISADATNINTWWDGAAFDRILLDAPCSATGVIRRHPDIKLLRQSSDLAKLADIQKQLLHSLWQCLKPGGFLVYATCSVLKQENENVIENFLKQHDDAEQIEITAAWGITRPWGRQLFPQAGGHDGFYYAKLVKR